MNDPSPPSTGEGAGEGERYLRMKYFLCVIGMVLILEGLPYFAFPDTLKSYLRKLTDIPDATLRIMGSIAVVLGLILVYFGTR